MSEGKPVVFLRQSGPNCQQLYRALLQKREEVARDVDDNVLWKEGEFRVELERDGEVSLSAAEADLEAARQWMAENLVALRDALQPHLDQLM